MKLCSACKKNVAIIFTTKMDNGKTEMNGLCIDCAKKMGIPVIDQLMQQTGMSKEDVDNLTEQMNGMFQGMDIEDLDSSNMFSNFLNGSLQSLGDEEDKEEELENKGDSSDVKEEINDKKKIKRLKRRESI